ncbi:MAG: response regulator [Novosphingobium sp.]|jgi:signal transduction histidine kinase/ActR/RegA family two-component response regulator|nr:response regulator [Novosphingobium sp.]
MTLPALAERRLREGRWAAGLVALLLIAVSLLLAWQSEQQAEIEHEHQTRVHARILAGSVAGALAFDDRATAREFLDALRLNNDIQAAAVYGAQGEAIAGFVKQGAPLPVRVQPHPPMIDGNGLSVVEPVRQGSLQLGNVYVRAIVEPWPRRASRYFGIGAVIIMAALLIAVLGMSYAGATVANRRLQEEIDAREKAEAQLRQAQKMEAIGQITGGVAHDFNNMLMAASSGLELLERARDPERREKLKRGVRDALDRGARLTQQLLTFSRRTPLQKEAIDIPRRMHGLAGLLEHSLREDISVQYELAPDLWPIEADPSQFDVAMLNIAVNARDAMPRGGRISIAARNLPHGLAGHDAVRITVRDEGAGMSSEQIEKAFEPFFTTKDVGHGTGLGLSQVYGFTRASGGSVAIDSREGQGTTVTLTLPRCERAPPHAPDRDDAMAEDRPLNRRVLLVEDDDALAEPIGQMIEALGCEVIYAASADAAMNRFDAVPVDAVLSDMVMPGERNGLDLARELRSRDAGLPILLMTGYCSAACAAAEEGFEVLAKPFTLDTLAGHLRRVLPGPKCSQQGPDGSGASRDTARGKGHP